LATAGQTFPHVPQFVVLLIRNCSHPLSRFPSQLPKPLLQANPHTPLLQ
jgi:hypothetical protein